MRLKREDIIFLTLLGLLLIFTVAVTLPRSILMIDCIKKYTPFECSKL